MRARFRFTLAALGTAVALLAWGAFVTSIDAGLAVPDWPTSFSSYDPFNPWPDWWRVTPVLAEHGHRLVGALVGLLTLVLAIWTWKSESRSWMRRLAVGALGLVILQGLLGGLRVVWVSLPLAVIHACVAQVFFAVLSCMALFTSDAWNRVESSGPDPRPWYTKPGPVASLAVYGQIILGALLRHPGIGIDPVLAGLHLFWAGVTLVLVLRHAIALRTPGEGQAMLRRFSNGLMTIVLIQVTLGFLAYFVLLDELGILRPSNLQVIVNSLHLVVGAALFSLSVVAAVATWHFSASRTPYSGEPFPVAAPAPSLSGPA